MKKSIFWKKNRQGVGSDLNMCGFDSDFFLECKSKSISGGFIHQAGIFGVKCFSIFCGLILADSKSGEILIPNDLIALGFCSYKST